MQTVQQVRQLPLLQANTLQTALLPALLTVKQANGVVWLS